MIEVAHRGRVYFGLKGDFSPDDVTDLIGLTPSQALKEGERNPERGVPKCSLWDFSLPEVVGEQVDIYDLSEKLVDLLEPHEERIAEAVERWNLTATLQVVLDFAVHEAISMPPIGFSERVIRFLADVGGGIDIDTYTSTVEEAPREGS
jgi:hypothetical protein